MQGHFATSSASNLGWQHIGAYRAGCQKEKGSKGVDGVNVRGGKSCIHQAEGELHCDRSPPPMRSRTFAAEGEERGGRREQLMVTSSAGS